MSKLAKRYRKGHKLFQPDEIKTQISQAVYSDLSAALHEYGCMDDSRYFAIEQQRKDLTKKYVNPNVAQDSLIDLTYAKFLRTNDHMANFVDGVFPLPKRTKGCIQRSESTYDSILRRARSFMHFILTDFVEDEWFSECKHSSGSSIGVPFTDTSLEAKSSFPMSITKEVVPLMNRYLDFDYQLKSVLAEMASHCPTLDRYCLVDGSRATTVEKNESIRRLIAVEPTGNMYFQQGLMAMMYKRMRVVGLDVERLPQRHVELARLGSITGNIATIDFSSASDTVAVPLVRYLLPAKWFHSLDLVRCKSMTINGQKVHLNMFSTMGNAGTFPLETLVFYTLAMSVYYQSIGTNSILFDIEKANLVSVFGDDCIVPTEIAKPFIKACNDVGFMVNEEKSFIDHDVRFRESCGGDFLAGYNVRPFFLKGPTSSRASALEPWLYTVMNGVTTKYMSYFGTRNYVYSRRFFELMQRLFGEYNLTLKVVPPDYPDDSGFKISFDLDRFCLCYRFHLAPIYRSRHGTYKFKYLRFVYKTRMERYDPLHLVEWYKRPRVSSTIDLFKVPLDPLRFRPTKRVGGYVVASGYSCHWHVPQREKVT